MRTNNIIRSYKYIIMFNIYWLLYITIISYVIMCICVRCFTHKQFIREVRCRHHHHYAPPPPLCTKSNNVMLTPLNGPVYKSNTFYSAPKYPSEYYANTNGSRGARRRRHKEQQSVISLSV